MSAKFRPPRFIRVGNAITTLLLRLGVPMRTNTLLTVAGRKSGVPRTTPVTIIEYGGGRYIQSPFGEVDWIRNLRAAGTATLTRGRHVETISAQELTPEQAAPILKYAVSTAPSMIQAYFNFTADSPLDEVEQDAPRHPTFRLEPATA